MADFTYRMLDLLAQLPQGPGQKPGELLNHLQTFDFFKIGRAHV